MEITIKNYDIKVTVSNDEEGLSMSEAFDMFFTCLRGITFQQVQIDNYIRDKAEEIGAEEE